jgi:cytochrome c5
MGQPDPTPVANQVVQQRIQSFGQSLAVDPNVPKVEFTGEQVYNEVCAGCHASGALGSPKFEDKAAWGKRNAQGYPLLLEHALKGFNKMPARGGDPGPDRHGSGARHCLHDQRGRRQFRGGAEKGS